MLISSVGLPISALDTPALLLDLDAFDRNAAAMSATLRRNGKRWRPHAKAFKCPAIAHLLQKHGARGVTVAKVSEAEIMAAGGIDDILIAHMVVGDSKAARLAALQRRASVLATVDHVDHLGPLSRAATAACTTIGLLVDVDLGLHRTGVPTPEAAAALARRVGDAPGLHFAGLMGYEGHTLYLADPAAKRAAIREAYGRLDAALEAVASAGLACEVISAGGSGSYRIAAEEGAATEIQAGGGVFGCRYYDDACHVDALDPSLTVRATIVGHPSAGRAVLDVGLKAVSNFMAAPSLLDRPGARFVSISAEHAVVEFSAGSPPKIGEFVDVVPGYSDLTFVLHDRVLAHRGGRVEAAWDISGRGMLQ